MKPFVVNARIPVLAGGNQTCPLKRSQSSKESRPGSAHTRPPVPAGCLLSCNKKLYLDRSTLPLSYKVTSSPKGSWIIPLLLHWTSHRHLILLWWGKLSTFLGAAHFLLPIFTLTTLQKVPTAGKLITTVSRYLTDTLLGLLNRPPHFILIMLLSE